MFKPLIFVLCLLVATAPAAQPGLRDLELRSQSGLVVSSSDYASDIGATILRKGGNAVDAAVATAFAMAVTHPSAGNIGGGGFMVVRLPDGTATTFDYRETAPSRATPTMYLGKDGQIDRALTAAGYLAPGVPGTVRGMALAHQRLGKLSWKELVLPSAQLAEKGFKIAASLAGELNAQIKGAMAPFPASISAYGKPDGRSWKEGDRLVLPDLAKSLHAIAKDGPDAFYRGWIADRIAEDMAAHGGLINKADLAAYQAKERAPLKGTFLGYDIISMPPPSSGGTALIEMLNMLEAHEIQKKTRGSVEALHLITEVMRRAFLDRARFLGDPDFTAVPVSRLTSKTHAVDVARTIQMQRASKSAELGRDLLASGIRPEPNETTHFSVLDQDGMAVSNTYTLEGSYGSHLVIKGTGILLNNEMGDFNKKPGTTNLTGDIGSPANQIAPGKRMLSSMTPTIVARDGKVVLITGSPGGRTIINTVLNVVLNVTAWGRTGREAVDAPRLHHQWLPDVLTMESDHVSPETLVQLRALGHDANLKGRQGSAQSIWIQPQTGIAFGIIDQRDATAKASK